MDELDVTGISVDGLQCFERISPSDLWQELTTAVARDWPGRPDPISDSDVLHRLQEIASRVAGQSRSIRRQMIDDAPGVILLAFRKFQRSRPFSPWAQGVLRNHAISIYRRERRMRSDSLSLDTLESRLALPEDHLIDVLLDFRRLCDVVRFPLRTEEGPELAAVFALETRLRLLGDLVRRGRDFLDSHLPLRDWEQTLRVQSDWPTLAELWDELANSGEPGLSNIESIRRACRRLIPTLTIEGLPKVWNTWLHRSKDAVGRQLESNTQAQLFFYLFPNHRPLAALRPHGRVALP
jgi:hypothetical protein